ncbi:MAG TPA: M14 metallopeptidase family protein [Kofleriaceae bacterium]|nr:M14 metallopeptidase family protein [Kofleriaceae bacterium]
MREVVRLGWLAALAAAATLCVALWPAPAAKRVAIRVACDPGACALAESLAVDVWSEDRGPSVPLDLVVSDRVLDRLDRAGVRYDVLVPDVDAAAAAEAARIRSARPADWFGEYRDYAAITARLHEDAELAPDRVALQAIGSTIQSRPIWAVRIGHGGTPMLVEGTQHAREWIAAMTATCVADRMVRDYDRDPAIRAFVDTTTLWVIPVGNPDGYQYTWSTDRYWRKNRNGAGVDLNRNFGVAFGGDGSSDNPRSEVYRGPYAFSENESQAVRDLARRVGFVLHVDFHAYGQLVMYPWSYSAAPARDRARLAAVGDRMASAMFAQHETRYRLLQAVELYPAAGTVMDWMYGEAGVHSYAIELRPRRAGFVLPPDQIKPTCDEGMAAVLALRAAH